MKNTHSKIISIISIAKAVSTSFKGKSRKLIANPIVMGNPYKRLLKRKLPKETGCDLCSPVHCKRMIRLPQLPPLAPLGYSLPGGGVGFVCSKRDLMPDGTEFIGIGISPDVEVIEKVSDIRQGIDIALIKAIDFLTGK